MSEFKPKGEDVLRQEVISEVGLDPNADDFTKEAVDKIVKMRLKDEEMKTSLWKSKQNKKKENDDVFKGKEYYKEILKKNGIDPKTGEKVSKDTEKPVINEDDIVDKATLRVKGYSKQDFSMMEDVREIYKKRNKIISLDDARKTKLFLSMKAIAEDKDKDKKAQLGAGGASVEHGTDSKLQPANSKEKEFMQAMTGKS